MTRKHWTMAVAGAAAALMIGAVAASATEPIAPGDYSLTVPGIGDVTFTVSDTGTVSATALPDGYTFDASGDEAAVKDATGASVMSIEVGGDEFEAKVALDAGTHTVDIPGVGTVTVDVAADGTLTPGTLPDGWTLDPSSTPDLIKLVNAAGHQVVVRAEDKNLKVKFTTDAGDNESATDSKDGKDEQVEQKEEAEKPEAKEADEAKEAKEGKDSKDDVKSETESADGSSDADTTP